MRLGELFAAIDDTWFKPHDLGPAGADEIANYGGRDIYLVLDADGELVAYGMLRGWEEGYMVPSLGIAVRANRQRTGFARTLMGALHEAARRNGASKVRLRVADDNLAAIALYQSMGYEDAGYERGERVMVLTLIQA